MGCRSFPARFDVTPSAPLAAAPAIHTPVHADPLVLHPDRFFDSDPAIRRSARDIYDETHALPLICPHGHVDPWLLADNAPFSEPTALLITPDHYIFRMLYSQGIPMESMGIPTRDGAPVEVDPRQIWQRFAEHFHLFRGTPTGVWFDHELYELFGVRHKLSGATAAAIYDQIAERLASPEFLPRTLFERFRIEVLATTDAAGDTLDAHQKIRASGWSGRGGQTRHPFVIDRNPCGSSSGTGTAISANLAAVGIGTETDGSIICPSSICGLVGIKPTVGLWSRSGIIPISSSQDTAGPMARSVSAAATLLGALTGVTLQGAALSGVSLTGASLVSAQVSGALLVGGLISSLCMVALATLGFAEVPPARMSHATAGRLLGTAAIVLALATPAHSNLLTNASFEDDGSATFNDSDTELTGTAKNAGAFGGYFPVSSWSTTTRIWFLEKGTETFPDGSYALQIDGNGDAGGQIHPRRARQPHDDRHVRSGRAGPAVRSRLCAEEGVLERRALTVFPVCQGPCADTA